MSDDDGLLMSVYNSLLPYLNPDSVMFDPLYFEEVDGLAFLQRDVGLFPVLTLAV